MRRTKWVSAILAVSMVFCVADRYGICSGRSDRSRRNGNGFLRVEDLPEDEGLERMRI